MKIFNKWLKVILLFLILITISCAPFIISKVKNIGLINKIHKDPIGEDKYIEYNKLGVLENIKTIVHAKSAKSGTVISKDYMDIAGEESLIKNVITEISKLQKDKVLPTLDIDGDYTVRNITKLTYIDGYKSLRPIKVFNISFEFKDFDIKVSADIDTGFVYEFFATFNESIMETEDLVQENYFNYLGLNKDNMIYKVNNYSDDYIYKDDNVKFTYAYGKYKNAISFSIEP